MGEDAYKIAILGTGGVGKTCIVLRLTRSKFDPEYVPTIQDFFEKQLVLDSKSYTLNIIDTAGQEEMGPITDIAIKEAQAFIIVYSVKSMISFQETEKFYNKIKTLNNTPKIVLCGNMCDVPAEERSVTESQGTTQAAKWNCKFFETSAKDDVNINEAFIAALKLLIPSTQQANNNSCCVIA
ncbi:small GTP-binding protein, putative [Trichomonas vaginalis G3]|uniref:Small GTP-binding protein, putative n=2 Tax=Trichomonas vaginalis TaxID=5722 RepID=A0A8U0WPP8_TRIV3|nr:small Ras GTPase Rsp [Trichomonas vaginalis G3]ABA27445.1 small Ras GTPase Rsp [Trichomonas vaginalis]EAY09955.1 small GTP-binding protein, putative [Trichomonas vaginalis G3]KAI5523096.1 small Ras GTPase Rsp [Trichomonas vaginalis G3]|eukprot:XP_001322178.1 small GTP-binding protein [Trichomonas vaginalis G3]